MTLDGKKRRGITTLFQGLKYRSRLEARWAAMFQQMGWDATYDPFDGNGYIPDFLINGASPLIVEVKPAASWADYHSEVPKIEYGLRGVWSADVLIVGLSPSVRSEYADHAIGLLGQCGEWEVPPNGRLTGSGESSWDFEPGIYSHCSEHQIDVVVHSIQSYHRRPCGCYPGGHIAEVSDYHIKRAWAEACNAVRWTGSDA